MSTNREICFVIMPFSKTADDHIEDYWTKQFEGFLKPLIEEIPKLEARRSKALRGDILREIITDLVVSRVVVADLTDHNPNVYWELGVRQSFKHCTVTIAEAGTKLPFDIGGKGTLSYYPKNHLKMTDFCERFKEAVQDCLVHPDRPDSHVLETLSGRGTLFEIFRRNEAIRRLDALLSECIGNLNFLNWVYKRAQNCQKNPENFWFPTNRFRVSAIELLITNRYIDEDESFFKLADAYLNEVISVNNQLNIWYSSPESTAKWLFTQGPSVASLIKQLKKKVASTRETLGKRF